MSKIECLPLGHGSLNTIWGTLRAQKRLSFQEIEGCGGITAGVGLQVRGRFCCWNIKYTSTCATLRSSYSPLLGPPLLPVSPTSSASCPAPVGSSPPALLRGTSIAPAVVVSTCSHSAAGHPLPSCSSCCTLSAPAPLPASELVAPSSSHVTATTSRGVHCIGREGREGREGHAGM